MKNEFQMIREGLKPYKQSIMDFDDVNNLKSLSSYCSNEVSSNSNARTHFVNADQRILDYNSDFMNGNGQDVCTKISDYNQIIRNNTV